MQLRPYQEKMKQGVKTAYRERCRSPLLVAPTGSGKSTILDSMLQDTKMSVLILAHRGELCDQISDSLSMKHGRIGSSRYISNDHIQIGTMQTVSKRLDILPNFQWIISDEAHISLCPTWKKIIDHYKNSFQLGMSATPCRLSGEPLSRNFDRIIMGPTPEELIKEGYLSPLEIYAPPTDFGKLKISGGDYAMSDASDKLDKPAIVGCAIEHYKNIADRKRAIVFCCSRIHAEHTAEQFRANGYTAYNVDGSMQKYERKRRIQQFKEGRVQVLTNVELLTTGFDCPPIEVGIMLRPTMSESLYIQQVGRIMRISEGKKKAILLDHVNNTVRHGSPIAEREWSLEGNKKDKKKEDGTKVKLCPFCYYCMQSWHKSCPSCHHLFIIEAREVPQLEGTLEKIDLEALNKAKKKEQGMAGSYEALVEVGKKRGMPKPHIWARYVMKARENKRKKENEW